MDGGIYVDDPFNGELVIITNNDLETHDRNSGISVRRSMASGNEIHTIISHNTILNINPSIIPAFGIHINGIFNGTDYAIVEDNFIRSFGTYSTINGIRFTGGHSDNTWIDNNDVLYDFYQDEYSGIFAFLGETEGSQIAQNTIIGGNSYDAIHDSYGTLAFQINGIKYCANSVDNLGYGMAFSGNCDRSAISQNSLDHLGIGLFLKDYEGTPGIFGIQRGTLNIWLQDDDFYDPFAAQLSSNLGIAPELSHYLIEHDDINDININPLNIDPPTGWFEEYTGENDLCYEIDPIVTVFDELIINDDSDFTNLDEPVKFFLKKKLLYKILSHGDLTTAYSTYLTSVDDDSEYDIAMAEVDMKDVMQMNLTDQGDLDNIIDQIHSLYDSIKVINDYNYTYLDSLTFSLATKFDSLQSKLEQIWELTDEQQSIKKLRMNDLILALETVEDNLDLITPRSYFDQAYIDIYKFLIKEISFGYLEPSDYDDLNAIAQEYSDGSMANATAFATFNLCSEYPYPDFSRNCEEEPRNEGIQVNNTSKSLKDLEVNRNSTNEITLITNDLISGRISVFDLTGKCVYSNSLEKEASPFKLNMNLVPGIYYYTFTSIDSKIMYKSGLLPQI